MPPNSAGVLAGSDSSRTRQKLAIVCVAYGREHLALSQAAWPHQFGEYGIFPAPKSTDVYRTP